MSQNVDALNHTEQARRTIGVAAGKDSITGAYNLVDINDDGKASTRNYVWDANTMSWVAMASTMGSAFTYDEIDITSYNANNDPLQIIYKLGGVTVSTLDVTYDVNGRVTKVVRS